MYNVHVCKFADTCKFYACECHLNSCKEANKQILAYVSGSTCVRLSVCTYVKLHVHVFDYLYLHL